MARLDALEQEWESAVGDVVKDEEVKKESSPAVAVEQVVQDTEVQQSAPQPAVDDVMKDEEVRQESSPDVAVEQEVQDTEVQQSATQPAQAYSISTGCSSARPCI